MTNVTLKSFIGELSESLSGYKFLPVTIDIIESMDTIDIMIFDIMEDFTFVYPAMHFKRPFPPKWFLA